MPGRKTAKLFITGRSQAVRLPKEFRLPGTEVRVSRQGRCVILEPVARESEDVQSIFREIDRLLEGISFPEPEASEDQHLAPDPRAFFEP